ncbi:MAG: FtsH protease activity modulator HflK [Deltaproteobacteria bacterium]|nr:FtsH protease activity modulator HflK [Deltaproteobacteria bacterium]
MRTRFDQGDDPDVHAVVAQYRDAVRKKLRWVGPGAAGIVLVLLLLSSLYSVEPGEIGVVRTFGRETAKTGPGLHFAFPVAQRVDVVNVEKIRRIEVGFRGDKRIDEEALMITGDENIVEAQVIVQYRITDAHKALFHLRDPDKALQDATEIALRAVVGLKDIDDVLTKGREQAQGETRKMLQGLMDLCQSGLLVTEVKLQVVDAPDEVKDAFHDVVRAREEKEQKINSARGYTADRIPKSRGEAQKMLRAAEAYKEQRILQARGDAAKFDSVFAEYEKAKDVTRERLHLETLERILGKVEKKILIDGQVGRNLLPVLPLGGLLGTTSAAAPGGR